MGTEMVGIDTGSEALRAGAAPGRGTWEDRVDWALSSAMAAVAAREAEGAARRALAASAFDELCRHVVGSVQPVLEACADKLRAWGVDANVHQARRDTPVRMPRAFDVVLTIDKVDRCGPGSLTVTAVEGREVLRVVLCVGPACIGGEYEEHQGVVHAYDLTDDAVGGLVATLVEHVFR